VGAHLSSGGNQDPNSHRKAHPALSTPPSGSLKAKDSVSSLLLHPATWRLQVATCTGSQVGTSGGQAAQGRSPELQAPSSPGPLEGHLSLSCLPSRYRPAKTGSCPSSPTFSGCFTHIIGLKQPKFRCLCPKPPRQAAGPLSQAGSGPGCWSIRTLITGLPSSLRALPPRPQSLPQPCSCPHCSPLPIPHAAWRPGQLREPPGGGLPPAGGAPGHSPRL
jgi:hypothetical protein